MPRPSVEKGHCAKEGRGLVPFVRQVKAERQILAPMAPGLLGDGDLPGREVGKRIGDSLKNGPARQSEAASMSNNVDFVDFKALQTQGYGLARPAGAQLPSRRPRTRANPRIEPGNGGAGVGEGAC